MQLKLTKYGTKFSKYTSCLPSEPGSYPQVAAKYKTIHSECMHNDVMMYSIG